MNKTSKKIFDLNKLILSLDEMQHMKNEDSLSRKNIGNIGNIKNLVKKIDFDFDNYAYTKQNYVFKPNDALLEVIKKYVKNNNINSYEKKEKKLVKINTNINTISDLLELINAHKLEDNIEYNINMNSLHAIKEPLIKLNKMVGMTSLKETVIDQILYFAQNLHINSGGDYMHTIIYGPPGTGKTEIAKLIGQIYSKMGILSKGTFKKATRSDLIAGYLGQTAIKTTNVINECLGGVLFIDEAYSLGSSDKKDSFSKECIDTLCEAMSNHKENFMVIIAGYENEIKESFFSVNQGLESRFMWRFKTDDYKGKELHQIFLKMINQIGWKIVENDITASWFEKRMDYFKYYGRDVEMLLSKVKIAHSKRVFCKPEEEKKKIASHDLDKGFEVYLQNEQVKNRKEEAIRKQTLSSIYV